MTANRQVEDKLRQLLLPVFGLDSIDEVPLEASLVNDLGMDSIDFVEVIFLIERNFGVVIKMNDFIVGGVKIKPEDIFDEEKLNPKGALLLNKHFPEKAGLFQAGMTRIDLFSAFTVGDLSNIIRERKGK
ncbi:MAG: acyl carrier protein [bacterium]|nr:acyl carrier protein [bacterium]